MKKRLTLQDVQQSLADIRATAQTDPEHAHGERSSLYLTVLQEVKLLLRSIKQPGLSLPPGNPIGDLEKLVTEALKAKSIKLRWEATA